MTQSLAEIKKMLEGERKGADVVNETTPSDMTSELAEFCRALGGDAPTFVPVIDDPHGLYGWCSDGVTEKVKADGGDIVFGWTIWEWPNVLRTAEFHAVWQSPDGALVDITPKPKRETRILFVADRKYPATFNFDNRPGNRRQRLYQPADPAELAADRVGALGPSQLKYELGRAEKAGMSLQHWLEAKVPKDTLAPIIDELISACDDHEAYFDTLGVSGIIAADAKLVQLVRRRMDAQQALKRALGIR